MVFSVSIEQGYQICHNWQDQTLAPAPRFLREDRAWSAVMPLGEVIKPRAYWPVLLTLCIYSLLRVGLSTNPALFLWDTLPEWPAYDSIWDRDKDELGQLMRHNAELFVNLSFSFCSFPQLNCGRFHTDRLLPSVVSRPSAKISAATEAARPTYLPREHLGQVYSREVVVRIHCPGHVEVRGQRSFSPGVAPSFAEPKTRFMIPLSTPASVMCSFVVLNCLLSLRPRS